MQKLLYTAIFLIIAFSVFMLSPFKISFDLRNRAALALYQSDYRKIATKLYGFSAKQGDLIAANNAGVLGVANPDQSDWRTKSDAFKYLDKAASGNLAIAHYNLIMYNGESIRSKRGLPELISSLKKASALGDKLASKLLKQATSQDPFAKMLYILATSGDPNAAEDYASIMQYRGNDKELRWALEKSANAGHANAMIGLFYNLGATNQSKHWLIKAANLGQQRAAYLLGKCYLTSTSFCKEKDLLQAYTWFKKVVNDPKPDSLIQYPPIVTVLNNGEMRLGYPAPRANIQGGGKLGMSFFSPDGMKKAAAKELANMQVPIEITK